MHVPTKRNVDSTPAAQKIEDGVLKGATDPDATGTLTRAASLQRFRGLSIASAGPLNMIRRGLHQGVERIAGVRHGQIALLPELNVSSANIDGALAEADLLRRTEADMIAMVSRTSGAGRGISGRGTGDRRKRSGAEGIERSAGRSDGSESSNESS